MDLSVVVVTWNSRAHVLDCLRSLERGREALSMEVLVVDNASSDGTPALVRECAPWARVIETGANLGYAGGVNRGLAASSGEAVLVLNPDCVVGADALVVFRAWMRDHPRCAIVGPRIMNPDGSVELSARSFPSAAAFLFNRYSLLTWIWPRNPWSRRYLLSDWDHASPRSVDWVSGACMWVRRAAIEQAGGMDEAYFMFNEDVDWCHAMVDHGWTVDYVPAAEVLHHVGASRHRVAPRVIRERHRGMIHYYVKHHRPNVLLRALVTAVVSCRAQLMLLANAFRN